MAKTDPATFLPLHKNRFHILLSLVGCEQHGYGIMQDVLQQTDGAVRLWPATLYGSIRRLIEEELIEESNQRPAREQDDLRRRYYKLTSLGRKVIEMECIRLEELLRAARKKRRQEAYE